MLEGPGLLSRLAQELRAVRHGSRLTWPEFRRDPGGFIRRAVGTLDELGLIPFSRRYVTTTSPPEKAGNLPRGVTRPKPPTTSHR